MKIMVFRTITARKEDDKAKQHIPAGGREQAMNRSRLTAEDNLLLFLNLDACHSRIPLLP